MLQILKNDLEYISSKIDNRKLNGKNFLVTGATGLIGFNLVGALAWSGHHRKILAFVRNREKAKKMYKMISDLDERCQLKEDGNICIGDNEIILLVGDVTQSISLKEKIDFIIHAASQTSSKAFVDEPVETISTALIGTHNLLELAKEKKVESFVYLSTMEIYGAPSSDERIKENHGTDLDTMLVRSSYPESKRMCETLCKAYQSEYGVPAKVLRLTQTFGPGVQYEDGRVFAEFARCVVEEKDIILHTKGETKRNYLYTADAITAILTVLLQGKVGEAYNAANEDTYCSIYDMAKLVVNSFASGKIHVLIREEEVNKFGYAPVLKMNLDSDKLQKLGWKPNITLVQMFDVLIVYFKKIILIK